MDEAKGPDASDQSAMREYRKYSKKKREERLQKLKRFKWEDLVIRDVVVYARPVDMTDIRGTDQEVAAAIDEFYKNDGRFLRLGIEYPPSMIDRFGKDYRLNAQGIYYHDRYSPQLVTSNRKVWIPAFEDINWEEPGQEPLRNRARVFVEHNLNNERWNKSEYAWEADAWSDVFGEMRNDPCLETDKHDYFMKLAKTDPVSCMLTGESKLVQRTPDATFGLSTFSERDADNPIWAYELMQARLEKLLLHRKCGLLTDPKWGETNLVFPFAVHEAKGWSGDCSRRPGPVESIKPYQTVTSHHYQVFALTSFGAHWHVLVGYRRPREAEEHAGVQGMSETVYIFQKIWSGRVINERTAWEFLSLIEQIHLWAITEFRSFVLGHLKPWHMFCEENYLLDWGSVYDVGYQLKRKRTCDEGEDLLLPSWVNHLSESSRQKIQLRAKESLVKALKEDRLRKGKGKCVNGFESFCMMGDCYRTQDIPFGTVEAYLDHKRSFHCLPERHLVQIKRCFDEALEESSRSNLPLPPNVRGEVPLPYGCAEPAEAISEAARSVEIQNHDTSWNGQEFVWTVVEELEAADLIDGEDDIPRYQ